MTDPLLRAIHRALFTQRAIAVSLLLLVALAGCNSDSSTTDTVDSGVAAVSAAVPRDYGEPSNDQIRPGVTISSSYGTCTSNFLFYLNADTYYIGTAAHCFSQDTNSGTDPCDSRNAPRGFAEITIENADHPGELVYSSWDAMQQEGEQRGGDVCSYNDFALVRIHHDDLDKVHPSAIHYGGPTALYSGLAAVGDDVYSYGQSPFHAGVSSLQSKQGRITSVVGGGWLYRVSSDNPGLSGDSGSAVLHENGQALAILSDVGVGFGLAPVSNGVVNLEKALAYAKASGFIAQGVQLATWSEFSPR